MKIVRAHNLVCPIDGFVLNNTHAQLSCSHGHSFDIARHDYVNLLLVQDKRSKEPGDSKAMVAARAQFLNGGFYQALAARLIALLELKLKLSQQSQYCIVDAGCGEGYYLACIRDYFQKSPLAQRLSLIGIDISKAAIIAAAKRQLPITWLVASNRKPPIAKNSVDVLTCLFGFQSLAAFHAILSVNGQVILVEPGPFNLHELRQIIYSDVALKSTLERELSTNEQQYFTVVKTERLKFNTGEINNDNIKQLLLMTPHFFRANAKGRDAVNNIDKMDLTVDVVFKILQKKSI